MSISSCILNLEPLYQRKVFEECYTKLPEYGIWRKRKENILKYKFMNDKIRSLGAGLLLLYLLKSNGKEHVEVEFNQYGKPYLWKDEFQFNLSHCGNYAVCSYGLGDSGIDIEDYHNCDHEIAKCFFDKKECEVIEKLGENIFIRFWTLKESYIKAVGGGMSIPLNSFHIVPGRMYKTDSQNINAIGSISNSSYVVNDVRYHFIEFAVASFHVAVCSTRELDPAMKVLDLFSIAY